MPKTLTVFPSGRILACAVLLGAFVLSSSASAQMYPPAQQPPPPGLPPQGAPPMQGAPPPVNPVCPRLETQLATIDRGGSTDPATDDQIRRYQDAQAQQQAELDRVTMQAKRMGCDSTGFFSLFTGQSARCGPVNTRIQQMRANLDQITNNLERLRAGGGGFGGPDRDSQRRSVLIALAQNNCGPQYANAAAAAAPAGPGSFFNNLFGGNNNNNSNPGAPGTPGIDDSSTYRTVCVRTCDGGYFPISFATPPSRFADDERTCKAQCPATEAELYAYRNPGEDINQAVSINGQPYTALPNAFKFRTEFNPSCACKAPGQTWADALKSVDDKADAAQQGDIIVTEESAKKMQQRAQQLPKGKKGAPTPAQAGTPATNPSTPPANTTASSSDKSIRTVGPKFLQDNQGPSIPR
ncbi:MAG TPA: DUF2865 domain-containing protein [Bradyrhizobium sp.]|uniref:DUF2865 domain-containing protein n=1 Tax=Bradyrhizobium sp. TaxID=376 RepID=UPI002BDAC84B|nr:DUF2865 domain-containing protein [Bradyrhizobium sp.]HLZ02030.1 DUF2865 domain-containing protein [Bradyrhizobium sp.]